jgi:cysteine desulfurase
MFWTQKKQKRIYMDYAATTPVHAEVLKMMMPYFEDNFGNPGSIYQEGIVAKNVLNSARKSVANILNTQSEEIIFTSGGTEANNLAILGTISDPKNMHAVTSVIEHPSVLEVFRTLERQGLSVTYIGVDESGVIDTKDVRDAIQENTVLISIIYINNEIGTIQPIREIAKMLRHFRNQNHKPQTVNCKQPFFHCDASQAPLYLSLNTQKLGVDMLTIDGQKIYGPKGVGCLYKKRDIKINSIIKGGNQEGGMRAGTENIPFIVGFAKSLELANKDREKESKRIKILRDYFISELNKKIPQTELNGDRELRSPNNVNIYIPNINGEFFVVILDSKDIACATRSACGEGDEDEVSYVIQALGYSKERAKSSLRFSLGKTTTKKDIDYVVKVLSESVDKYSNNVII